MTSLFAPGEKRKGTIPTGGLSTRENFHFTKKDESQSLPNIVTNSRNIHPIFSQVAGRAEKEARFGQRARVVWLFGLSGSGKSTLAAALERRLLREGRATHLLDGDNLRSGLNRDLGFTDGERAENIRRVAEVSRLFLDAGLICINAFITPREEHRKTARSILGEDLLLVYVRCSFEACAARDVKGLYRKAGEGGVAHFTGRDSGFDEPADVDLAVDTEGVPLETSLQLLHDLVRPAIAPLPTDYQKTT